MAGTALISTILVQNQRHKHNIPNTETVSCLVHRVWVKKVLL